MNANELEELRKKAIEETKAASSKDKLEEIRIRYLGRKGIVQEIIRKLKEVDPSERPLIGRIVNEFKEGLRALIEERMKLLEAAGEAKKHLLVDCTLPGRWHHPGTWHPVSLIIRDAVEIFSRLGFALADGPDIETKWNNFDALNTPEHHPSTSKQDTFWLNDNLLLRTHTSPVQIRVMTSYKPPIRIITAGRCYRRDTVDATHSVNFHQIEGLYVVTGDISQKGERSVSMADLKSDLAFFARKMMGPTVKIRFRPHFFPFTEPSVECDFSCHLCNGKGCSLCKGSGWIEIAGAGMVHPAVFEKVGYDPAVTTGYAFGMGIERIAMVKYGITDIRLLYENDVRYLAQVL
jgi:phenylalanyl-tRNA synthetase alpha chain